MTPRERFVEAMRHSIMASLGKKLDWKRQAIEAFADLECRERACHDPDHWKENGVCPDEEVHGPNAHSECRAALLKECGLEVSDERAE